MGALQQALGQQIYSRHNIYPTVILMMMTHLLKTTTLHLTLIVRNFKNRLKSSFHMLQMHHNTNICSNTGPNIIIQLWHK